MGEPFITGSGSAVLDGSLILQLDGNLPPEQILLVSANSISGQFQTVDVQNAGLRACEILQTNQVQDQGQSDQLFLSFAVDSTMCSSGLPTVAIIDIGCGVAILGAVLITAAIIGYTKRKEAQFTKTAREEIMQRDEEQLRRAYKQQIEMQNVE